MRLTNDRWLRIARLTMICLVAFGLAMAGHGQAMGTTTVQGTVYLANGHPSSGTLMVSWPAFTTAAGQLVAADQTSVTIGNDGFVSINLAPNQGALPAGQYYTAVFYMSDGTVNTQYWIVPAAAQATLAQIQAQVMPAAQAVQAVSKAYVDEEISELTESLLTASGGNLTGPLYLNADPTQPLQAADKHYVDTQVATAVPLAGGNMSGPLTTPGVNGVEAPAGSQQTSLQAAMNAAGSNGAMEIPPKYAGTDTFSNPNGVRVTDLRTLGAQQTERSVKEFGAVCDGVTDDTAALQSAINYAQAHGVALTIPEGTCKTRTLNWHGESIGGLGKQVSSLMGFPGQDVLATTPDNPNVLSYTRIHDLTIYVDQSEDVSCSPAEGRATAGSCQLNRPMESNTIFSPGGNGLNGTAGSGAGWSIGNCAIAMQASSGAGGNGLKNAQIENLEIVATGTDPMATQYSGAHSTHTCGLYLAQWPQWSDFINIDIRGLNTGVAIPALPVATPAGLLADSNRWQNITIQATHGFTAVSGCNGVLDDVTAMAGNSAATGEPPTGIVLDLQSTQEGWTVRNAVVIPNWNPVEPALTMTTASGAVTGVTVGADHGLGWDPYGTTVPLAFSGSCTAQATAVVNSNGSIGAISVTQGGSGCSSTTTASVNAPGSWDTAAPVNLIGGQNMTFFAGSLLRGHGGYTVWNATGAQNYGTQVNGGGGNLPGGGSYPAFIANNSVGSTLEVDQFPGVDFGGKLQACVNAVNTVFGGICDARNFTGSQTMSANLTISTPNATVLLPCATITTANQVIVTAGTRNVALRGCAMRGGSEASGSQGGTAFAFSGTGAAIQVGDSTYAVNTPGFHMDNSVINTIGSASATAQGLIAYRTQEIDLEDMYFLGNSNQTGMTLDGTGNYAGGTIRSVQFAGFQIAVNGIGHQVANPATTDWMNASTFVRLHIDCPTSNGNPIAGTVGINLRQGDGNTFTGGDVEGCATALHLGLNAQNNTIIGLRNENSTSQVVADAGSAYNNWITGGTMFTGQLTDNGTRNSFQDTFHRSLNGMNGDWYGSQQDATVTNHFRLGTGTGNERGLLNEYQTDYGYRWTEGLSDATGGEQFYQILDQLNNVYRISIGQYNNGQSSTNDQTAMNSAGTGAVVLNSTSNSGTGGVIFGSGGPSPSTVATIDNSGNAQFNGTLLVGGTSQSTGTITVRNNADAEVDYYLWPGLTTSQKGSFTYKDWNGNSQWYMVKDSSNNWALNSALGGLDSFKAYQSTNSGDTYIDTSNSSGHIRLNYETGSGAETDIYSGSSLNMVASFLGPTAIKFPGLAPTSGHNCLQIDNSGYLTNTGSACGSGTGSGTVSTGNSGQIAYYTGSGTTVAGISAVPIAAGGTGSTSAAGAMATLLPGVVTDGNQGVTVTGNIAATTMSTQNLASMGPRYDVTRFGAAGTSYATTGSVNVSTNPNLMTVGANSGFAAGQFYQIPGAGVSGASLLVQVTNVSGNSISFTPAASTTVSGVTIDDTLGIQAAATACAANSFAGAAAYGGVVEFPGTHTYTISNTISLFNSCRVEGVTGSLSSSAAQAPPLITWVGPAFGATSSLTGFTVSLNVASITLTNNPKPADTVTVNGVVITFVSSGASGNQVNIGASAAATATALYTLLNTYTNANPIYTSEPFTNPSSGVVDFKYQSIGLNGATESVVTNDPTNIAVQAAYYSAANPSGGRNYPYKYLATLSGTNSYAVNNWVYLTGLSTQQGLVLNHLVTQVVAATGSTFTVALPFYATSGLPAIGTYTDSGNSVSISVDLATDSYARYQQQFKDIEVLNGGVGIYEGSRLDTGSDFINVWMFDQRYFGAYLTSGAVNMGFDKGWRTGSIGVAGVYLHVFGDYFSMDDGQTLSAAASGQNGAGIMLDNEGCNGQFNYVRLALHNMAFEAATSFASGLGAVTLYDCVSSNYATQFQIDMDNVNVTGDGGISGYYTPAIAMSPLNDTALNLSVMNSTLPSATNNPRWVGIPSLIRQDAGLNTSSVGSSGFIPWMTFSPAFLSMVNSSGGSLTTSYKQNTPLSQNLGDFFYSQLYQYGIKSAAFLYSDSVVNGSPVAPVPNGTTLYAGQILAPPAYWNGANGKRYALDVVNTAGTTGTPNSGSTTCSAPGGTAVLTCTSGTDLSVGQWISVAGGSSCKPIIGVNAFNPSAVLVSTTNGNEAAVTNGALSFCAPVPGSEIQLLTKSAGVPSGGTWSQGDISENSSAAVNGVAGYVYNGSTWDGIPLGNSSGLLAASQVYDASSTSPECPNGPGGTLTTSGCLSAGGTVAASQIDTALGYTPLAPDTPAWLQYLGTGATGAYNCATGTCTLGANVYNYTTFNLSTGATLNMTGAYTIIYATGACTINGTLESHITGAQTGIYAGGGSGGGGGGGTAAGTAATGVGLYPGLAFSGTNGVNAGGTAGAASGGAGGNGNGLTSTTNAWQQLLASGVMAGYFWQGAPGGTGGSGGGAGGFEGNGLIMVCASITGTGTIVTSGSAGSNAAANNQGAGGGGGAGPLVLSSQASETFSGLTLTAAGGSGGSCSSFTGCGAGGTGGSAPIAAFSGW